MNNFRQLFMAVLLVLTGFGASAKGTYAIVIDTESIRQARAEVEAYASAVEAADGYKVVILEDRWGVPDSLRAVLIRLHADKKNPLVGAVFVGDIPVAMIRGAQHLASAFKMDEERYPREDSSIPSDRFYDDFSLSFKPLGKDENHPWFYYVLAPESAQRLRPDIFTGRIRPVDANGKVRVDDLKRFLLKAADARTNPPEMNQLLFFSGHGYNSESKTARLDEKRVWLEHFPLLDDGRNHVSYIDYSDAVPVKSHLMNELMRQDLNVAMLHHHGAPDTEYLNAEERPYMVKDAKQYMIKNMRSHLWGARERGKDYQKMQEEFKERFDVPDSWFADAFDPEMHRKDSLADASLDLYLDDFQGYGFTPQAQVVILDACYNGSFHLEDCIADRYIFSEGSKVVAVQANSVNSLQDKWADRFFGIIAEGAGVGNLSKFAPYLESHIIGDPTFRFKGGKSRLDEVIMQDAPGQWKKLLRTGSPDVQALSIEYLHRKALLPSAELLSIYRNSPYAVVRMEALWCLSEDGGADFVEALKEAVGDADEFIRRNAVKWIGRNADPSLIPTVVATFLENNATSRVAFNTTYALHSFDKESLLAEFDSQAAAIPMAKKDEEVKMLREALDHSASRFLDDETRIMADSLSFKERRSLIRQVRSYANAESISALSRYVQTCDDPAVQVLLLEALGWHGMSCRSGEILDAARKLASDGSRSEEVRAEALKTINRLKR